MFYLYESKEILEGERKVKKILGMGLKIFFHFHYYEFWKNTTVKKYKSRVKRSLWKNVTPNIWTFIFVDNGWNGVTEHTTKGKILILYDTGYTF